MTTTTTPGDETTARTAPIARRDLVVLLVAAACLQAIAWAILLSLFSRGLMGYGLHQLADTLTYDFYGVRFAMGQWPYAQVPVEYPPLANLIFLVAPSGGTVAEYERWFSTAMIAATVGAAVATTAAAAAYWRSLGRALATAVAYAALTLCCGALAVNRYDAVVALVIAVTLLLLAHRAWLPAAVGLGLGFALKLTPALLVPLLLVLQTTRRKALLAFGVFAVAAAVPFLPFFVHDPGSVAYPFTYHAHRPLQVESVLGTPWVLGVLAGGERPALVSSFGSKNFSTPGANLVAKASPWLLLVAAAGVYLLVWRRREALRRTPGLVPVAALSVLLVAICASKVLSPQFLIWTFPLLALCAVHPSRLAKAAGSAGILATLLTQVEFPARYWRLVALEPGPLSILAARNLLLVAGAVLAVVAVARVRPGEAGGGAQPGAEPPTSTS